MSSTTHKWLDCSLSAWQGDPQRCRWCDLPLYGSNATFCQLECKRQAVENHAWNTAKKRVRMRDRRCVECGARRRLEVHHVQPCNGVRTFSCAHHLANLELLCEPCHEASHEVGAA